MKALRFLLFLHLAFFALWGAWLLTSHRGATEFWLETSPIDPRDLLSGHFVSLRYQSLESPAGVGCNLGPEQMIIFVRFSPAGRSVGTSEGAKEVSQIVECRRPGGLSIAGTQVWVRGARQGPGGPFRYGIERYYVPETSPLRDSHSGKVLAKIAVNHGGEARILQLIPVQ
jgi:hypothetical protein